MTEGSRAGPHAIASALGLIWFAPQESAIGQEADPFYSSLPIRVNMLQDQIKFGVPDIADG